MNVSMKQTIGTEQAPRAIGPYSQAVIHGGLVFLSGQIPFDPATGQLVGADIGEQTRRVLDNLRAVLEAAGSSLGGVLRTTVFLKDMADFPAMNAIYGEYFSANPPARWTLEVVRLPLDARSGDRRTCRISRRLRPMSGRVSFVLLSPTRSVRWHREYRVRGKGD